jgi:hypothetical protein
MEYDLYGGGVKLTFDGAKHAYLANGRKAPSVTTILKVLDKPALQWWAVNETLAFIAANWQADRPYTEREKDSILTSAKTARYRQNRDALDIGTTAHKWVENYVSARQRGVTSQPNLPKHPQVRSTVEAFLGWEDGHEVEYLQSERRLYSRRYHYAGTVDLIAMVDDRYSVIDFKTSKAVYPEYFLQGAAYAQALAEEDAARPAWDMRVTVVRIPKDGMEFEVVHSDKTEELIDVFLAARRIYEWQQSN